MNKGKQTLNDFFDSFVGEHQQPQEKGFPPRQPSALWRLCLCFGETEFHIWETLLGCSGMYLTDRETHHQEEIKTSDF